MAGHFLDDFVKQLEESGAVREIVGEIGAPWYNPYGDCIIYQTVSAAYIGDRVDEFLTILRHSEDRRAIGFLIKDVRCLLEDFPVDRIKVEAEVDDKVLKRVSLSLLLWTAFERGDLDPVRLQGYSTAMYSRHVPDDILIAAES